LVAACRAGSSTRLLMTCQPVAAPAGSPQTGGWTALHSTCLVPGPRCCAAHTGHLPGVRVGQRQRYCFGQRRGPSVCQHWLSQPRVEMAACCPALRRPAREAATAAALLGLESWLWDPGADPSQHAGTPQACLRAATALAYELQSGACRQESELFWDTQQPSVSKVAVCMRAQTCLVVGRYVACDGNWAGRCMHW
jgi:hypothetical protein